MTFEMCFLRGQLIDNFTYRLLALCSFLLRYVRLRCPWVSLSVFLIRLCSKCTGKNRFTSISYILCTLFWSKDHGKHSAMFGSFSSSQSSLEFTIDRICYLGISYWMSCRWQMAPKTFMICGLHSLVTLSSTCCFAIMLVDMCRQFFQSVNPNNGGASRRLSGLCWRELTPEG